MRVFSTAAQKKRTAFNTIYIARRIKVGRQGGPAPQKGLKIHYDIQYFPNFKRWV